MPSYLVPALYYSTNLSDVVLALLGPGLRLRFAIVLLGLFASAVLTVRAQNRAKEGRKSFMNPQKRYDGTMRIPLAAAAALGGIALHFI